MRAELLGSPYGRRRVLVTDPAPFLYSVSLVPGPVLEEFERVGTSSQYRYVRSYQVEEDKPQ